jgi:membrane-associated phospholipid phosphatase
MFQTELILTLQNFASDFLNLLMNAITTLGDDKLLGGVLIIIILGINYRKGLTVNRIFFWGKMLNDGLKAGFNLPRPRFVNADVQNLQFSDDPLSSLKEPGSDSFFGLLDADVVDAFRSSGSTKWGFPSGHVSTTTVLFGSLAQQFKKRYLYWLTPTVIVFVAITRMYLGRHFLADVLGGMISGGGVLFCAHILLTREWVKSRWMEMVRLGTMFVIPLLLAILWADVFGKGAGLLVGINAAALLISRKFQGTPDDTGTFAQRAARASMGVLFYFLAMMIMDGIFELTNLGSVDFMDDFLLPAVSVFASVFGGVAAGLRMGFFTKVIPDVN